MTEKPDWNICTCVVGANPAHNEGCPCNSAEFRAQLFAWYAKKRDGCGSMGHMPRQSNEWGMGFGMVDFFCSNCQACIETVRPDQLSREERDHIFGIVVELGTGQ